ncbi:hypothetical protein SCHPADRAFT_992213 [Schizopora paradoxa]|uniref:Dbl homology domain-containing protein n=1 Tax=Schizopora paradoxa TaxID=27342 RepID=A0A0H2S726_9AGAM|nr:hypothetical protein SCHPADRAFT_992213 [Schizopora paradoxa]
MSSPPAKVAFPSTDSLNASPAPSPHRRQPLLSFRRISLPSAPTLLNRQSSASLASFESFPEETTGSPGTSAPSSSPLAQKGPIRRTSNRPLSFDNKARIRKRRDTLQVDENKLARRKKIISEFYVTERAYVEGLDLIYTLFLTPIIESLETTSPLLDRADLIAVFSNFVDIWNLHRSFYTSLTTLLQPSLADPNATPPPLSPVLISHFPYLSLYSPFITSFPSVLSTISTHQTSNHAFAEFVQQQEKDPRCGKLKLRDWLLTIVQRCPRYLLLLKDLIKVTDTEDPEHTNLLAAHALLSKVTTSLDTSLHTHAQTLALLSLQRSTTNLPLQLISPGRSLLKRGGLLQLDNSSTVKEREFLLFTDCIMWLANDRMVENEWLRRSDALFRAGQRPAFKRSRSKSENEIPALKGNAHGNNNISISEDKWLFKGKIDLVDVEVVVSPPRDNGEERRLEILSPENSFAIYADTEHDRDQWVSAIRAAKASLLVSLNVMHPNSTLASSSSTNHLRRSLQALPYLPEKDEDLPRRGKVDHFVPAIWVPDGNAETCMRCGRSFGWRRRRHHCRLCGRCVCGRCSEMTFFIAEASGAEGSKSARACNACYDTVFPIMDSSSSEGSLPPVNSGSTLSSLPSWKTSKPVHQENVKASELMALNSRVRLQASPTRNDRVYRMPKPRPLSHPVLPHVFKEFETSPDLPVSSINEGDEDSDSLAVSELESSHGQGATSGSPRFSASGQKSPQISSPLSPQPPEPSPTARKRFSMPAIALQTTSVTARPNAVGEGQGKRFSLVLGGKQKQPTLHSHDQGLIPEDVSSRLRHGVAAARLAELLERTRVTSGGD